MSIPASHMTTTSYLVLQSDAMSLSAVIPALLELECHLKQTAGLMAARKVMREKFNEKFSCVLDPDSTEFNPLPAVSCLLDPTLALVMTTPRASALRNCAQQFIRTHHDYNDNTGNQSSVSDEAACPPALKKFKFLANQLAVETRPALQHNDDQIERY